MIVRLVCNASKVAKGAGEPTTVTSVFGQYREPGMVQPVGSTTRFLAILTAPELHVDEAALGK